MEPIQKFSYFLDQHMIYYTNSNMKQKLHKKKKKKNTAQRAAEKSARRPAHSRSAHAGAARALASTQMSLTAGPACQLRLQASACRIDGATEPSAPPLPLATRWSRSPLQGAPLDTLCTPSLLPKPPRPRTRRTAASAGQTPATTLE